MERVPTPSRYRFEVTLIANLLLMIIQKRIKRPWSFSGLATIIRIMLMYYVNCYTFLEEPGKDWAKMIQEAKEINGSFPNADPAMIAPCGVWPQSPAP